MGGQLGSQWQRVENHVAHRHGGGEGGEGAKDGDGQAGNQADRLSTKPDQKDSDLDCDGCND